MNHNTRIKRHHSFMDMMNELRVSNNKWDSQFDHMEAVYNTIIIGALLGVGLSFLLLFFSEDSARVTFLFFGIIGVVSSVGSIFQIRYISRRRDEEREEIMSRYPDVRDMLN